MSVAGFKAVKPKAIKESIQRQLSYIYKGEKVFLPNKTLFTSKPKTIAGAGTSKEIRQVKMLINQFGGTVDDWQKKVAKIESDQYI